MPRRLGRAGVPDQAVPVVVRGEGVRRARDLQPRPVRLRRRLAWHGVQQPAVCAQLVGPGPAARVQWAWEVPYAQRQVPTRSRTCHGCNGRNSFAVAATVATVLIAAYVARKEVRAHRCSCEYGFFGYVCQHAKCGAPEAGVAECSAHGSCNRVTGMCDCDERWFGIDCERKGCLLGSDGQECSGRGTCDAEQTCRCQPGFGGRACENMLDLDKNGCPIDRAGSCAACSRHMSVLGPKLSRSVAHGRRGMRWTWGLRQDQHGMQLHRAALWGHV